MALTRKFLRTLGIEEDKIDEIIGAHTDVVDDIKNERDKYKNAAELAAKNKPETANSVSDDGKDYKSLYDKEHSDFEQYKKNIDDERIATAKRKALSELIGEVGIKDKLAETIVKGFDLDDITIDDGKIKGADKLTEKIKSEWKDYIPESRVEGVPVATPPQNSTTPTRDSILKIKDAAERQKAIAENIEVFGKGN